MPLPRRTLAQLGVAAACVLVLPLIRFVWLSYTAAIGLQANAGYYVVLLAFGLFLGFLVTRLRVATGWFGRWRAQWPSLVVVAAAAVFLHLHEPHALKVLNDEPSHVACSELMHQERQAAVPSITHRFYGSLLHENSFPSFRQYFFPFLISLVHDVAGYSPRNVFVVNAVVSALLLLIVFRLGNEVAGPRGGLAGVLLLAGLPLLAQNATSGGYDVLNLTLFAGLLWATLDYSRRPGTGGLDLMLSTGVLLALTRYEALLYLLIPVAAVLLKWRAERAVTLTWFAAVSPLLLLPNLVSHLIMTSTDVFMSAGVRTAGQSFFSLANLVPNLGALAFYLFDFDTGRTNSVLLSAVGAIGVTGLFAAALLRHGLRRQAMNDVTRLLLLAAPVVFVTYAFMLTQFWSSPADLMAARFALPTLLIFVLAALWLVADIRKAAGVPMAGLWIATAFLVLFTIPANSKHRATNLLVVSRTYDWFVRYAKEHDRGRTLYVATSNLPIAIEQLPSITLATLNDRFESLTLALQAGVYDEIIVHEHLWIAPQDGRIHSNQHPRPDPRIVLEEIAHDKFLPDSVSRLYRYVGYRNAAGELVTPANAPGLRRNFTNLEEQIRYLHNLLK